MSDCIFCKIAKKEMPTEIIFEDEDVMVFPDINPKVSVHLLIIPRVHIEDLVSFQMKDGKIWEKMAQAAKELIKKNNLKGYRLVVNGGEAKLINHLHMHLMGDVGAERKL